MGGGLYWRTGLVETYVIVEASGLRLFSDVESCSKFVCRQVGINWRQAASSVGLRNVYFSAATSTASPLCVSHELMSSSNCIPKAYRTCMRIIIAVYAVSEHIFTVNRG